MRWVTKSSSLSIVPSRPPASATTCAPPPRRSCSRTPARRRGSSDTAAPHECPDTGRRSPSRPLRFRNDSAARPARTAIRCRPARRAKVCRPGRRSRTSSDRARAPRRCLRELLGGDDAVDQPCPFPASVSTSRSRRHRCWLMPTILPFRPARFALCATCGLPTTAGFTNPIAGMRYSTGGYHAPPDYHAHFDHYAALPGSVMDSTCQLPSCALLSGQGRLGIS